MKSEMLAFQSPILIRNVLCKTKTCEMQGEIMNILENNTISFINSH